MNKTLSKRIMSVITLIAALAMLIPAMTVPVSAAGPTLAAYIVNPDGSATVADGAPGAQGKIYAYNVANSIVQVTVENLGSLTVTGWSINPSAAGAHFVPAGDPGAVNTVKVQAEVGAYDIQAHLSDGTTISMNKKWGLIDHTDISASQNVPVTWNESVKLFEGSAMVSDTVTGDFTAAGANPHALQGVILNWYLVAGYETIPMAAGEPQDLIAVIEDLDRATFVEFGTANNNTTGTYQQTITGYDGTNSVDLWSNGEEAVKVVVVPQYPQDPQKTVVPEVTTVNFWTREMEVVPQVRWAGEKIVLEKNFFMGPAPELESGEYFWVRFTLTGNSKASLESILRTPNNGVNDGQTCDAIINDDGFASVILYCPTQGDIDVSATLYVYNPGEHTSFKWDDNQHHFVVYYLKLNTLTLGNVYGKRDGHNAGLWVPNNPWDPEGKYMNPAVPDVTAETLNVSEDTLLRAQVTGWFSDADGEKWYLPADWPELVSPYWKVSNIHWDIMNDPSDFNPAVDAEGHVVGVPDVPVTALNKLGDYKQGATTVASADVIGPFSPGIEQPAAAANPYGYRVPNLRLDDDRDFQTVVPNGSLDAWDAPMPPAKITYMITDPSVSVTTDNAGFFKEADKADIYYGYVGTDKVYTNPFYCINVPAHWAIPAFVNNGGYDWDTWGNSTANEQEYGPYNFWTILNRQTEDPLVPSSDPGNYPTLAQVYSDNHGEAMVYLNGDWNLDLALAANGFPYDIKTGTEVGKTTVVAMADYPYTRQPSAGYKSITSNTVTKTWQWGKRILGPDPFTGYVGGKSDDLINGETIRMVLQVGNLDTRATIPDPEDPSSTIPNPEYLMSNDKAAFIWVTDRDGFPAAGEKVSWDMEDAGVEIATTGSNDSLSNYQITPGNQIMQIIKVDHGFLKGTINLSNVPPMGGKNATDGTKGVSYLMAIHPDPGMADPANIGTPLDWASQDNALAAIFYKFYNPTRDPAGLQPTDYAVAAVVYTSSEGKLTDLQVVTDEPREGLIERHYHINFNVADDPDDPLLNGDANYDGKLNMGDIILVERMMLGLNSTMAAADKNGDGKVNIADVLSIEVSMLGL